MYELKSSVDDYNYLHSLSDTNITNVSDSSEFIETCRCLDSINIDNNLQYQIFQLLAGILNIGNINFFEDNENHIVAGVDEPSHIYLNRCSRLLGVTEEELLKSITKRNMHVSGVTIVKPQTMEQVI
jgi:myosin-5